MSAAYYQDSIVSAVFGSTKYNWKISYTGNIQWSDANNSVLSAVTGTGGSDVVLIGFSTESLGVPGDFNNDGKVDAGDYATWRKNDGANATLPNDNGVGTQAARFSLWRANFGKPPGAGAGFGVLLRCLSRNRFCSCYAG